MRIKHIIITGSSGMIGTYLMEELLRKKYNVIGVDKEKNKWNIDLNKKTIRLDLKNKKHVLKKLPKKIDLVIHLAANARVYNLVKDPSLARDNLEIIFNILEYVRLNNIKRFIFSSSREVYGNSRIITHKEKEVHLDLCESPYTASKIGGEALVHSYAQCFNLNYIIVRLSNVFGCYDDSDRVMPLFINQCIKNKDLNIFGKGKVLDFTYIHDCVSGIIKCINNFNKAKNDIYNLAFGKGNSILKVANIIRKELNSKSKIRIKKNRTGEVVRYIANIDKAKRKLGYSPKHTIEQGVKKTVHWYLNNMH
ncbi:MAG: NAD-dependent epimerase/dehydratase family protein [Candidatus Moranbacteria bacterium]|nr:NAD-dependent epimerase/dehydratase family protein [Candidatus Moranbacteria bacterium]